MNTDPEMVKMNAIATKLYHQLDADLVRALAHEVRIFIALTFDEADLIRTALDFTYAIAAEEATP